LPFIGAVNTYRDAQQKKVLTASLIQSAMTGATEIPATFIGYWANKILNQGFVGPWITIPDILWLSAGKAISQSVTGLLEPVFKKWEFGRAGINSFETMVANQSGMSNMQMSKQSGGAD
jgi:hypothetical protein